MHAFNGALIFVEFWFSRVPFVPVHLVVQLSSVILYCFMAWIVHAVSGRWVYFFLNYNDGAQAATYYSLLLFGFGALFFFVLLLSRVRHVIVRCRRLPAEPLASFCACVGGDACAYGAEAHHAHERLPLRTSGSVGSPSADGTVGMAPPPFHGASKQADDAPPPAAATGAGARLGDDVDIDVDVEDDARPRSTASLRGSRRVSMALRDVAESSAGGAGQ